ncbi:DnaT-like ssDNA-binding domain-containing protein [Pantoea septica]|uniref:DnaT-like ssDNA-binding domain-containing protein n=1 Tax=Pantoea septica TaxID=472695 RepID=UPI00289CBEDB|nr:DnaT-like ssDNA-binding domain-containing protein [Pantoea septica]
MSDNWIKMRTSLKSHPKVNEIAALLEKLADGSAGFDVSVGGQRSALLTRNVTRCVTVTSLLLVWSAANEHTSDGVFRNVDLSYLDVLTEFPGFGEAMAAVGWAIFDAENRCVILPDFCKNNVPASQRGSTNAERQRRYRERQKANLNVTRTVTDSVTRDVTVTLDKIKKEDLKPNTHTARARNFPDSVDNFEGGKCQTQAGQGPETGQGVQAVQIPAVNFSVTDGNRNVTKDVTHNVTRNDNVQRYANIQRYGDTHSDVTPVSNASGVTKRDHIKSVSLHAPAASVRTGHIALPEPQERFAMHSEWQPSSDLIQIAAEAGIKLDKPPDPAQIAEFRTFWRLEGKKFRQAQWDLKLAQRLVEGRQYKVRKVPRRDVNAIPDTGYKIPEGFRGR